MGIKEGEGKTFKVGKKNQGGIFKKRAPAERQVPGENEEMRRKFRTQATSGGLSKGNGKAQRPIVPRQRKKRRLRRQEEDGHAQLPKKDSANGQGEEKHKRVWVSRSALPKFCYERKLLFASDALGVSPFHRGERTKKMGTFSDGPRRTL